MAIRTLRSPAWTVRARILAAILVVAALGLGIAGGTAYLVERSQTLRSVDQTLLDRVEAARVVALTYVPDTVAADTVADTAADAADSTGSTDSDGSSESTSDVPGPADPGETASTTREVLDAIFRSVIPGSNESAVGIIDGVPAVIPGVTMDFTIHDDDAFIARVTEEAAPGEVVIGGTTLHGHAIRYVLVPISVGGDSAQGIYVAAVDLDVALSVLHSTFQAYAIVALATLVAIALVGWFVAGRLLSPLRELRETASRITQARSSERIPVRGHDDVSELTRTINGMLDRLNESAESERQLLDDVRHELKTPITIVRGHLELADPNKPADVESARDLALDELDRMTDLVDDLDLLAEVNRELARVEPVELAEFMREVHAKASVIPGRVWTLQATADGLAYLDRARVTQALLQLSDNAAKFSPEGSEIRLGSARRGPMIAFWVDDDGPGIPPGAESRIFERFGRAHTGRGVRGSGLGLSIVTSIAEAHGGSVSVTSDSDGAQFTVLIPAKPTPAEAT